MNPKWPGTAVMVGMFMTSACGGSVEVPHSPAVDRDSAAAVVREMRSLCTGQDEGRLRLRQSQRKFVSDAGGANAVANALLSGELRTWCERAAALELLAGSAPPEPAVLDALGSAMESEDERAVVIAGMRARPQLLDPVVLHVLDGPQYGPQVVEAAISTLWDVGTTSVTVASRLLTAPPARFTGQSRMMAYRVLDRWRNEAPELARATSGSALSEVGAVRGVLALTLLLDDRDGLGLLEWCRASFASADRNSELQILGRIQLDDRLVRMFREWAQSVARDASDEEVRRELERIGRGHRSGEGSR